MYSAGPRFYYVHHDCPTALSVLSFLLFLLAFRFLAFQVYKSKGHRISFFYEYTRLLDLFDWNWERYKKPNASLYIGAGLLEGLRHHGFWWFGKT